MLTLSRGLFAIAVCTFSAMVATAEDVYQAPESFIAETFDGETPTPQLIWLTKELKEDVADILGHPYSSFRIRYWKHENRTAWILEEIGKLKPITTGIVIENAKISRLKVLVYRESHGWEVKYPFFSNQFKGIAIDDKKRLDQNIDGISGATLSVEALERLALLALYLDSNLPD
jgi:hypothetical protein